MNQGILSVEEALARLLGGARALREIEEVATLGATGRVLARASHATINVPRADNTAMDGYAVRVADCAVGMTGPGKLPAARLPVSQRITAGSVPAPLAPGTAARIFTGALIPPGADAVVMQEMCSAEGDDVIIRHSPATGEWIRRLGEDIRAGEQILDAGTRLRPQDIGLAASVGIASLPVYRRLRVAAFFTGNELVMPGEPLPEGAIYNSNRFTLTGLLQLLGCEVVDLGIVADDFEATRETLRRAAAQSDLVLTSGGVSVGEEDHIKPAVQAEGRLEMWKIAIKPGKPLAFGHIGPQSAGVERGAVDAAFIGLPGNPASVFVTFAVLVRPFILRMQGVGRVEPAAHLRRADFDWPKPDARREYLRVKSNEKGGLDLYPNQGSGVLSSAAWAEGLADNPPGQKIQRGEMVRYLPFAQLFG